MLFKSFIAIAILFISPCFSNDKDFQDIAVFKVQKDIFFYSDVTSFLKLVKKLQCIKENATLIKALNLRLNLSELNRFYNLRWQKTSELKKFHYYFDNVLSLIVLNNYVKEQMNVSKIEFDTKDLKKCNIVSDEKKDISNLLKTEKYFADRYLPKDYSFLISLINALRKDSEYVSYL